MRQRQRRLGCWPGRRASAAEAPCWASGRRRGGSARHRRLAAPARAVRGSGSPGRRRRASLRPRRPRTCVRPRQPALLFVCAAAGAARCMAVSPYYPRKRGRLPCPFCRAPVPRSRNPEHAAHTTLEPPFPAPLCCRCPRALQRPQPARASPPCHGEAAPASLARAGATIRRRPRGAHAARMGRHCASCDPLWRPARPRAGRPAAAPRKRRAPAGRGGPTGASLGPRAARPASPLWPPLRQCARGLGPEQCARGPGAPPFRLPFVLRSCVRPPAPQCPRRARPRVPTADGSGPGALACFRHLAKGQG
jgi:hypothetical protein